jgi:parallel beta-helix repeat protein
MNSIFSFRALGIFFISIFLFASVVPVFAGTLTNTTFSWSNDIASETNTLMFEYTNETFVDSTNLHMVFRGNFGALEGGALFDFENVTIEDTTVTLDGIPATITYVFGDLDTSIVNATSYFEVRIAEDVDPGTAIVVTIEDVVNSDTPGNFIVSDFGTADAGGQLIDTPGNNFAFILLENPIIAGTGTSEDPYQFSSCFTITEPGYYEMTDNIFDVVGDCIDIQADNVFIDGGGFSITSDGLQENSAILTRSFDSVGISNITIDEFGYGILLMDVLGASFLSDITINTAGIHAIDLQGVTDMLLNGITINSSGVTGILIAPYDTGETYILSEDITIMGVTIADSQDNGILAQGVQTLTIEDFAISDIGNGSGIAIRDFSDFLYTLESYNSRDVTLSNGTLDTIDFIQNSNAAIDVNSTETIVISGILFTDVYEAIDIIDGIDITISQNTIENALSDGIDLDSVEDVIITGNTITNAGSDGIYIVESLRVTVSNNTITGTGSDGIDLSEDGGENTTIVITDNTLTAIGDNGIELDEVYGATITGNTLEVSGDGIAVDDSADIVFTDNIITPFEESANVGLDLDNVATSSFYENTITAAQWVFAVTLDEVRFDNGDDMGNTYYFLNGQGAWDVYDIRDSDRNGFADTGDDLPFNTMTLGEVLWFGEGEDRFPGTLNRERRGSTSGGYLRVIPLIDTVPQARDEDDDTQKIQESLTSQPSLESLLAQLAELQKVLATMTQKTNNAPVPLNCKQVVLRQNDRGDCVRVLQGYLNGIPQTGFFGPLTLQAVIDIQTNQGLVVDGIVGPTTWNSVLK